MATLASSTVASWGRSTDAGSFLMGFLGARLLSLSESVAAMVGAAVVCTGWLAGWLVVSSAIGEQLARERIQRWIVLVSGSVELLWVCITGLPRRRAACCGAGAGV